MTNNRRAKREARDRHQRIGERYVVARRRSARRHQRYFENDCCANCLEQLPDHVAGLFCSELCQETCDTVRYWRRVDRGGRYERPNVPEAVWTRVAFLLAGGYGNAARRLSSEVRSQVWERDGGICRSCGEAGEEVDHIDGDSADMGNLRLLCKGCFRAKTNTQKQPITDAQKGIFAELLKTRVHPMVPALLADDETAWKTQWPRLKKARRDRLIAEMEDVGLDLPDFRGASRADMVAALIERIEDEESLRAESLYEYSEAFNLDRLGDDDSGFGPNSYFAHAMAKDD